MGFSENRYDTYKIVFSKKGKFNRTALLIFLTCRHRLSCQLSVADLKEANNISL